MNHCSIDGCEKPVKARGICNAHYVFFFRRQQANGIEIPYSIPHRKDSMSSTYKQWAGMKTRCSNPNHQAYKDYGGRGIRVCDRWLVFKNFLVDMGERPSKLHSLDRIDVNGNYEPSNVRWATPKEQVANKRKPS